MNSPRAALRTLAGLAVVAGSMLIGTGAVSADTVATSTGPLQLTAGTAGTVLSGVASTYTVTVTNTSSLPEWGIQIGGQLPAGMTLNTLLNPDLCARSNKQILPGTAFNCGAGNLDAGSTVSIAFTATAASPGLYTDALSTTGIVGGVWSGFVLVGGVFTSNSLSLQIQANPGPTDIQVTGSSSTGSPPLGSTFSYTFQVKDNGPQGAYGVSFDDALPAALAVGGASTDTGTCSTDPLANSVHCDLGNLAVGAQAKIVVTAVAPAVSEIITDTATIAMIGPDTHPANNSVSVTVQTK